MNDDELLQLLAEKSPRELTDEEIAVLRERAKVSPEIRAALSDLVMFETGLSAVLGAESLSVERLLGRAEERLRSQSRRPSARRWWLLIGLTASLILAVGLWKWTTRPPAVAGPEPEIAADDGIAPEQGPGVEPQKPGQQAADNTALTETLQATSPVATTMSPAVTPVTPAAVPADPAKPPEPAGPWEPWVNGERTPLKRGDRQLTGDLVTTELDRLSRTEFEAWWMATPGQNLTVTQEQIGQRPVTSLDGSARLKAPWLEDTRLRFVSFDDHELTLCFWQGRDGIALRHYREREPHTWAAFRVKRNDGQQATPVRWELLTTDSGAHGRSGAQTWDVSTTGGALQLSVADVVVLSVPLTGVPDAVDLQGKTRLRGFRWVRAEPPQSLPVIDRESVLAQDSPAEWDWQTPDDGTMMLQRDADGSVVLTSMSRKDIVRAFVPLPEDGLYETLFQVATADPGTGIYLGDEAGQPLGQLAFCRDKKSEQVTYVALRPQERREETDYQIRDFPPPYFVPGQWLRIMAGLGTWQTACSADGVHFGYASENPLRNLPGKVRSVGLFCWPSETPRTIRLQAGRVQRLNAVEALIPPATRPFPGIAGLAGLRFDGSWWNAALGAQQGQTPVDVWLDQAAIATLKQGPPRELADALVVRLCRSAARRLPADRQVRVLDELLMLSDHRTEDRSRDWAATYARLASPVPEQPACLSGLQAWQNWVTAPGCSFKGHREEFQAGLMNDVLTPALTGDWATALMASANVLAWLTTAHPDQNVRDRVEVTDRLARWTRLTALDQSGGPVAQVSDVLPAEWRHPLVTTVNKEAYNVHAELQAALDNQAYADASRIVAGLQPQAMQGLLPQANDGQLLVSLNVALELAARQAPGFREQLLQELTPTGWLRVRQAMAIGDPVAVQSATLQCWGTAPAAAAFAWLGDRALSLGDPVSAVLRYRASQRWADAELQASTLPRRQLAEGLAGLPRSKEQVPANPPGSQSTTDLTTAEVLRVLDQAGAGTATLATPAISAPPAVTTVPRQPLTWEPVGRFDGQAGQNAGRGEFRHGDAFGRQFAVASSADHVYISNRFQINALRRDSGQRVWARGLGSEQGEAHAFPFIAMQPVVAGERIYLRSVAKAGVELACLRTSDGQPVWLNQAGDKANYVSDPIVIGDSVWCLVSRPEEQEQIQLEWTQLSAATGATIKATPILRVRDVWNGQLPVTLTFDDLNLIAALGGAVIGFDLEGTVHWLRREPWLPTRLDPLLENQRITPPAILGDRTILATPGGRRVLCLSVETGTVHWKAAVSDLQGLLYVDDRLVLAATPDQIIALEASSGKRLWQQALNHNPGPVAVTGTSIFAIQRLSTTGERGWPELVELDRQTGAVRRTIPWNVPEQDDLRFGPWWQTGAEVWGLSGQGWREPQREIVRLQAQPGMPLIPETSSALNAWSSPLPVSLQRDLQLTLPGWQVYGVAADRLRKLPDEIHGEREVLQIRCEAGQPVRCVRVVGPRAERLRARVGCPPEQACRWQVLVDGVIVKEWEISANAGPWQNLEVTLPDPDGSDRLIQIVAQAAGNEAVTTYWKQLVIDPEEAD